MNPREKKLAIAMGVLLAAAGLWAVVKYGVVKRWQTLQANIAKTQSDAERYRKNLEVARAAEADWSALRPLSHNVDRAQNKFLQNLHQLLDKNGLAEDCTVTPQAPRELAKTKGMTEVRATIAARGTLQQIVNFLCDFHERDYLARLDRIKIAAEQKPASATRSPAPSTPAKSSRRRGSRSTAAATREGPGYGAEGPTLNVTIEASALVLGELKIGNTVVAQPTAEAGEDAEPVERLPRARDEYARIWESNIFKLWQEPPPPPPREVATAEAPAPQSEPEPQYEPPPPSRPNKRIGATISMSGKLAVLILDCDDPGRPSEKVEINQPVDDGTLVLVIPGGNGGMVVQVPERRGVKYYFYPFGHDETGRQYTFADRREIDPRQDAQIQAELNKVLRG